MTSEKLHHILKFFLKFAGPEFLRWGTKFFIPAMFGKDVVVIGGGLHGCQTAEFLSKRGRNVTIVDTCSNEKIGEGLLETFMKPWLLLWLDEHGVKIIPEVKYEEINSEGLIIVKDGRKQTLMADTIITAMPMKPDTELIKKFRNTADEFYAIGDTKEPNYIVDAIEDGSWVAREI
jgi:2,4-dienoyl-CoA reductase (NADPH2)